MLRSGNVKCWGENDTYGELGTGDDLPVGAPMSTPLKNAAFIDLGTGETAVQVTMGCALLRSGRVKCWGRNDFGQLGIGDTTARGDLPGQLGDKLPPVNLGANVLIHEVIGDPIRRTVCALLNQGAAKCWGDNTDGRLGSGQPAPSMGGSPGDLGDALPYLDFGVGNTVAQVVSASPSMCARLGNGQVRCWGASLYGALGTGNSYNYYIPSPPIDLGTGRTAAQIAGGDGMVCAILDDQSLKCWGSGDLGLGDTKLRGFHPGEMGDNLPPVNLGTGVHAVQVATSGNHTCVVLNTGYVKCWGHNLNGELGLGDAIERGSQPNQMGDALPVVQLGDWPVKQVAVGNVHSCALFGNGAVKCWGNYIAIGLGDYNSRGVNKADMGANLAYVDLRDVPMGSGAPDAGPADAGSADAGPPDAGPTPVALADVFDPNQVYFSLSLGTAQGAPPESGTACTNIGKELFAAYPLSAPAAIEGGFTCEAKNFRIHPKTGRILYLGEDAVREFHCDTCDYNDWPANIVSYPFDSASNDPVISTSGCTSAPVWEFALTPEGHIRYQCYQQTAIYDENGNVLSFAGDLTTFAFGANGVTLPLPRSQFPPYLLDASGHMVSITGGPSSFHSMVASRSYGSGFRVAIQPTTGPVELWTITAAGAATKEWTYGTTVPGGAVLDGSWNLVGFASGSIIQISPNATSIKSTAPDPSTTYAFTGP